MHQHLPKKKNRVEYAGHILCSVAAFRVHTLTFSQSASHSVNNCSVYFPFLLSFFVMQMCMFSYQHPNRKRRKRKRKGRRPFSTTVVGSQKIISSSLFRSPDRLIYAAAAALLFGNGEGRECWFQFKKNTLLFWGHWGHLPLPLWFFGSTQESAKDAN